MRRAAECAAAYERGSKYWAQAAARPRVAAALTFFLREPETRPRGRLDLVSWVQWVCAFGGVGPARPHWHELFRACCCDGDGAAEGDTSGAPLRLSAPEVAVLLAFWGCGGDDAAAEMTNHNLVKGRVRPAVEGRSCQARTPGILSAVEDAFADFVYSFIGRGLLEAFKRDPDLDMLDGDPWTRPAAPAAPGVQEAPSNDRRNAAMAEVQRLTTRCVRDWELVVRSWLRLRLRSPDAPSVPTAAPDLARAAETARVFLCARADARTQLRDAFFRKLFLRLWRNEPSTCIGAEASLRSLGARGFGRPGGSGRMHTGLGIAPVYSRLSFDSSGGDSGAGGGGGSAGGSGGTESLRSVWSAATTVTGSAIESVQGDVGALGSSSMPSPAPRLSLDSLSSVSAGSLPRRRAHDSTWSIGEFDTARLFDSLWPTMYPAHGVKWRREILDALTASSENVAAEARFTVLELHAPGGRLSKASVEFLPNDPCDIVPRSAMHPACPTGVESASYERTACFRLAGADSCLDSVEVPGARPSSRCRALQIVVGVVEVPPAFGDDDDAADSALCGLGGRHRFRGIRAEWVDLDGSPGREDECVELDPENEILNDDWEDRIYDSMAGCVSVARAGGTARHMMNGAAMVCSIVDVADDVFQFPVRFRVPQRLQRQAVRRRTEEAFQSTQKYCAGEWMEEEATEDCADGMDVVDDGRSASVTDVGSCKMEEVVGVVQLDCSVGARMFFNLAGGDETGPKQTSAERNIFQSAPAWTTRPL